MSSKRGGTLSERKKSISNHLKETFKKKFLGSFVPLILLFIFGLTSNLWYIFLPLLLLTVFLYLKLNKEKKRNEQKKNVKHLKKLYMIAYFPLAFVFTFGLNSQYSLLFLILFSVSTYVAVKFYQEEKKEQSKI